MKKILLIGAFIAALATAGIAQAEHIKPNPLDTTTFEDMGD